MFTQALTPDSLTGGSNTPIMEELLSITSLFDNDESRWIAVQTRDPDADGFFIYAVKTTKIYCRPICKARLARRANVSFFLTVEEARNAGFRACKRCKPDASGFMPEEEAIRKIKAFLAEQNGMQKRSGMSLSQMAKQTGLSKWHFHRMFKKIVGVTPVEYLQLNKTTDGMEMPTAYPTPLQLDDVVLPTEVTGLAATIPTASLFTPALFPVESQELNSLESAPLNFDDFFTIAPEDTWDVGS